jgi:glycosyltransferase involved in cell wall biosynthesis
MQNPATPTLSLSVLICSHNPRKDYLERTLAALEKQSLDRSKWELLLIDNASETPLGGTFRLGWHPRGRHVREEQLGLTAARLRGIREASAPLLLFVDDDNLLDANYLEEALRIAESHPNLGSWGAGIISPEFEREPDEALRPYLPMLTLRNEPRVRWSNELKFNGSIPFGAGLCCRLNVARHYASETLNSPVRQSLGRRGKALTSSEDVDLALTGCTMGFGTGVFPSLKLVHLIPAGRLQEQYLLKLAEARIYSGIILHSLYNVSPTPERVGEKVRHLAYFLRLSPLRRKFYLAERRGERRARKDLVK